MLKWRRNHRGGFPGGDRQYDRGTEAAPTPPPAVKVHINPVSSRREAAGTVSFAVASVSTELGSISTEVGNVTIEVGSVSTEVGSGTIEVGNVTIEVGVLSAVVGSVMRAVVTAPLAGF